MIRLRPRLRSPPTTTPGTQQCNWGWPQLLASGAWAIDRQPGWPRFVSSPGLVPCAYLFLPSFPRPVPIATLPQDTSADPFSGNRSQSHHFAVCCVSLCAGSSVSKHENNCLEPFSDLTSITKKSFNKRDALGSSILFIQGGQMPLTHCHGPPGHFFAPPRKSMALRNSQSQGSGTKSTGLTAWERRDQGGVLGIR